MTLAAETRQASTDRPLLREALNLILALEAATHRAQATGLINGAVSWVIDAADVLKRSKFSSSAIVRFRSRVSGAIMRASGQIARLGWLAGGGTGDPPADIKRKYLDNQQTFLSNWILQIGSSMTMPGGAGRARQYAQSLEVVYQQAFNRAKSEAIGLPEPPAMPRDGSTQCRGNCKCFWRGPKRQDDDTYKLWWTITPAEHCQDCLRRDKEWNPITYHRIDGEWQMELSG